jgi:hypothetical protein
LHLIHDVFHFGKDVVDDWIIDHALVVSTSARVGVDLAHNGLAPIIMSYGITGFSKVTSVPFLVVFLLVPWIKV